MWKYSICERLVPSVLRYFCSSSVLRGPGQSELKRIPVPKVITQAHAEDGHRGNEIPSLAWMEASSRVIDSTAPLLAVLLLLLFFIRYDETSGIANKCNSKLTRQAEEWQHPEWRQKRRC